MPPAMSTTPKDGDEMADETTAEIATYFRVLVGTRVRYADTKADSDTVILMLAPWPETL
jgi:hypothetical protein